MGMSSSSSTCNNLCYLVVDWGFPTHKITCYFWSNPWYHDFSLVQHIHIYINIYIFFWRQTFHWFPLQNPFPPSIGNFSRFYQPWEEGHTAEPQQPLCHIFPLAFSPKKHTSLPHSHTLSFNPSISLNISPLTWGPLCFIFHSKV